MEVLEELGICFEFFYVVKLLFRDISIFYMSLVLSVNNGLWPKNSELKLLFTL